MSLSEFFFFFSFLSSLQKGTYNGIRDAFTKIVQQEGFLELYRGLFASIVGVIPYAGANYFAYDTLCTLYKKVSKKKQMGHLATLLVGSSAGAFAASATFPLEVARKQVGTALYRAALFCTVLLCTVVHCNTVQCCRPARSRPPRPSAWRLPGNR